MVALIENSGFGGHHAAPAIRGVYDVYYRKTRHAEPPGATPQIAKKPTNRRRQAAQQTASETSSRADSYQTALGNLVSAIGNKMVAIIHKRSWRDFDWLLAFMAIAIVLFGTIQIRNAQPTETYWVKQLIGLSIGLVAMLAIAFTDYRRLLNLAPAFYIFGLVLLIIVLIPGVGLRVNGQQAWIKVPGIGQFQPSEFVKVTTAMMLARYFGKNRVQALAVKEMIVGGVDTRATDCADPARA